MSDLQVNEGFCQSYFMSQTGKKTSLAELRGQVTGIFICMKMFPHLHAAGNIKYAKSGHLYVQHKTELS